MTLYVVVSGEVHEKRRPAQAAHAQQAFTELFPGVYKNTRLVQLVQWGSWYYLKDFASKLAKDTSIAVWAEPDEGDVITSFAFLSDGKCDKVSSLRLM